MALETGKDIADLVATNPAGTDDRSTADDHLRLLKKVLKQAFGGMPKEIFLYGTASGTNTYSTTITLPETLDYPALILMAFTNANTGASTLTVNGTFTKTIYRPAGGGLYAGDIAAGSVHLLMYNGTQLVALTVANGPRGQNVATAGAIGTYALLKPAASTTINPNDELDGADLRFTGTGGASGSAPSGTWRAMGYSTGTDGTLFVRKE